MHNLYWKVNDVKRRSVLDLCKNDTPVCECLSFFPNMLVRRHADCELDADLQTWVIESLSELTGKLCSLRFFIDDHDGLPDSLFAEAGLNCPGLCLAFCNNTLRWSR